MPDYTELRGHSWWWKANMPALRGRGFSRSNVLEAFAPSRLPRLANFMRHCGFEPNVFSSRAPDAWRLENVEALRGALIAGGEPEAAEALWTGFLDWQLEQET